MVLRTSVPALDDGYVFGRRALLTLDQVELDILALGQRAEALGLDGGVMHEDVAGFTLDESETLGVVEPLDRSSEALGHDDTILPPRSGC